MSSKKSKSKSKKASEGDSSLVLKGGSSDSSSLQTSGYDGGSSDSFTVIDFINKGTNLRLKLQSSNNVWHSNYLQCIEMCEFYNVLAALVLVIGQSASGFHGQDML